MKELKKRINYLRSHLIFLRQLSGLTKLSTRSFEIAKSPVLPTTHKIDKLGYCQGPSFPKDKIDSIKEIYINRIKDVVPKEKGAPFVNLMRDEDVTKDNPIIRLAFSKEVLDSAIDYFGGKISFDNLQLLYSYSTEGELRESQYWHKDYGDRKSFHCVGYLNDVLDETDGPFVFVNKIDSKKIKKSPFIRRISDEIFFKELKDGKVEYFYGKEGESVFIDPAACYHYGSRCKESRLAIFFTFNTSTPYLVYPSLVSKNRQKLFEIGKELRPDLNEKKLKTLFNIK